MTTRLKHAAAAAVAVGMLAAGALFVAPPRVSAAAEPTKAPMPEGKSEPSERSKLAAQVPGVVKKILVKSGQEVKEGDPLIQQDDRLAVNQFQGLEKEATSTVRVDAAKWDLKQKEVERDRIKKLFDDPNRGATELELERAELDVKFKGAQQELSELELAKAKIEAEGAKLKVDFMKILAPFDGIVETIDTGTGEMLDPQKPGMLTIVKNDPIRIVVQLTAPQASKLKLGDTVDVRYKIDAADAWQQAKVSYLSPVATAGAGYESQREVHLEMPNPTKRETGLWLWVKVPDATSTASAAPAPPNGQ